MLEIINTKNAPAAIGPYSQALKYGNLIFCSGQIGLDPDGMVLVSGIEGQTKQVLKNIWEILKEAGSEKNKIIKTTIYLKNITDFAAVNEIYGEFFGEHRPARSTVEVSNLPKSALIEIEAIAFVD